MRYPEQKHKFPVVAAEQRIFLKSKQNFYDYTQSLLKPLGFEIGDYDQIEHVESEEQREWDAVTKLIIDHYAEVNGSWTYTCSSRKRQVDRKYRCIGGPLHGTNQTMHLGWRNSGYYPFNSGGGATDVEFSAVLLHESMMTR